MSGVLPDGDSDTRTRVVEGRASVREAELFISSIEVKRDELRQALTPFALRAAAVIEAGACVDDDEHRAAILLGLVDE